jgi:hypothetical protein
LATFILAQKEFCREQDLNDKHKATKKIINFSTDQAFSLGEAAAGAGAIWGGLGLRRRFLTGASSSVSDSFKECFKAADLFLAGGSPALINSTTVDWLLEQGLLLSRTGPSSSTGSWKYRIQT